MKALVNLQPIGVCYHTHEEIKSRRITVNVKPVFHMKPVNLLYFLLSQKLEHTGILQPTQAHTLDQKKNPKNLCPKISQCFLCASSSPVVAFVFGFWLCFEVEINVFPLRLDNDQGNEKKSCTGLWTCYSHKALTFQAFSQTHSQNCQEVFKKALFFFLSQRTWKKSICALGEYVKRQPDSNPSAGDLLLITH